MNVTIAIPVYNRAGLIRFALESALAQDVPGLEILVIDNASTDDTWEVLQTYTDPRLRLVRNETNVGLYGNLNRCLELATGDYVRILCSDDRLVAGCIAKERALVEAHPGAVMVSTRGREVDERWQLLRLFANEFPAGIYAGTEMIGNVLWLIAHYNSNPLNYPSGILLQRQAALKVGEFTRRYRLVGDIDYWFRLFVHGDVIVADHVGCEVMFHSEQEGNSVRMSGVMVDEFFDIARRWRPQLEQRGLYKPIMSQLAGCAIYTAAQFQVRGRRPDIARLYWQSARNSGVSLPRRLYSTARFAWMVQSKKRTRRVIHAPPDPASS